MFLLYTFRVDISNGLLSEKIKERVEKLNLNVEESITSTKDLPPSRFPIKTTAAPISNNLADRLRPSAVDSPAKSNNLNRRYDLNKQTNLYYCNHV